MKLLEIKNLVKYFHGNKALDLTNDIISINKDDIIQEKVVGLMGPNGSGKTTLFNIISKLLEADKGIVKFNNQIITNLSSYKVARKGIARTFQNIRLFKNMSVIDNILVAMKYKYSEKIFTSFLYWNKAKTENIINIKKALKLLKYFDLEQKKNELAGNLSYGQQKLLEFARIVATNATLLLLDEPCSGIHPYLIEHIKDTIIQISTESGKTIFFIEHNTDVVFNISDKIIVLDSGQKLTENVPDSIKNNTEVIEAYLGG